MRDFITRFGLGVIVISVMIVLVAYVAVTMEKESEIVPEKISVFEEEEGVKELPLLEDEENPVIVALKTNNMKYCDFIDNNQEKEDCKQVLIDVGLKNQAVANFDSKLCESIVNVNTKRSCLELTRSGEEFLDDKSPRDLAKYYKNNNNYDEAISIYEKLIESDPSEDNYLALALTYAEKGLIEQEKGESQIEFANKAISAANKAIEKNKESSYAYRVRGYAYEILPSYDEAISSYDKAIELDNENVLALTGRAHTYILIGDLEKANADFKKAKDIDPDNVYTNMNLCTLEKSLGNYIEAIKYCGVVISSEDTIDYLYKSQAYLIVGEVLLEMKNYTEAENNYLMAKSIAPEDPNVNLALIRLYNSKRELEKGEELAKYVIERIPTKAQAYEFYSYNLYLQGRFDESIEVANKGLELIEEDVSLTMSNKPGTRIQLYYIIASDYNQKGDLANKEKYEKMAEEVSN